MSIIERLLKSALFAAMVMPVILASTYMGLHDFGQNFLNADRENAFWEAMLALYILITAMILLFWEAKARKQADSS